MDFGRLVVFPMCVMVDFSVHIVTLHPGCVFLLLTCMPKHYLAQLYFNYVAQP